MKTRAIGPTCFTYFHDLQDSMCNSPVHVLPSPVYFSLQLQEYPPSKLLHLPFWLHVCCADEHSSISINRIERDDQVNGLFCTKWQVTLCCYATDHIFSIFGNLFFLSFIISLPCLLSCRRNKFCLKELPPPSVEVWTRKFKKAWKAKRQGGIAKPSSVRGADQSLGKDNVGAGEKGGRSTSIAGEGYAPEEADQPP